MSIQVGLQPIQLPDLGSAVQRDLVNQGNKIWLYNAGWKGVVIA